MIIFDGTYKAECDGAQIIIGGQQKSGRLDVRLTGDVKRQEKFVPNINFGKWGDDAWLNINHLESIITTEKETIKNGVVELSLFDIIHKYYIDENNNLEYEIILKSKPLKNIIELDIDFSVGLEFIYQPELTLKEIEEGFFRPENVIGSYAVYWNKKNNQYKTGKFCHIFRPKIIDAVGKEIWGELNIDISAKKLNIIIDQKFLDDAIYPIIVDPTIGYSTAGASNYGTNTVKRGSWFQAPASTGNTQTYHVAVAAVDAVNNDIKLGIYATTVIYDPSSPHSPRNQALIEQVVLDVSVSNDNSVAGGGAEIVSEGYYFLCQIPEDSDTKIKCDTGSETGKSSYVTGCTYANEMVSNWGNSTSYNINIWSIWVDYGAAGGTAKLLIPAEVSGHMNSLRGNMQ